MGRFGSGVTVVTVRGDGGRDFGMTASAFSSLSLDPPLVLVAVGKRSRMHERLARAMGFGVNVLSEHQEDLSNRFAGGLIHAGAWTVWPEGRDKFAGISFSRGETSGAALFEGCLVGLDCAVHSRFDGGDHTIFVGRVAAIRLSADAALRPLVYYASRYRALAPDPAAEGEVGFRMPDSFD